MAKHAFEDWRELFVTPATDAARSARRKIEDRLADMPSADHGGGWFGWHRAPEVIAPVVDVPIFGPGLLDD